MPNKFAVIVVSVLVSASSAEGQVAACGGPGAAFGVTSYQCASCGVKQSAGIRTQYEFQAEPIVLEVSPTSALKAGDVIVAVNGDPIMTTAGSDQFTYPKAGPSSITVRRGNSRVQVNATAAACEAPPILPAGTNHPVFVVDGVVVPDLSRIARPDIESVEVLRGALAESMYRTPTGRDVVVVTTKRAAIRLGPLTPSGADMTPLIIVDGVPVPKEAPSEELIGNAKRFGFAIGCLPSCSRARARDGTEYYRFDRPPPVVALTPGGLAERAGMRVGDAVLKIDGKSILTEEGVLGFFRTDRKNAMHVTVVRGSQELGYLLDPR
jgi:membrane-associated protease RseP (regulator of RpoE activity)